jgi:hypothetical protein
MNKLRNKSMTSKSALRFASFISLGLGGLPGKAEAETGQLFETLLGTANYKLVVIKNDTWTIQELNTTI